MKSGQWVPVTPGGTIRGWLASDTEQEAIDKLLEDASHMLYCSWDHKECTSPCFGMSFKDRGYTIEQVQQE